jgi:hypothetical protein
MYQAISQMIMSSGPLKVLRDLAEEEHLRSPDFGKEP